MTELDDELVPETFDLIEEFGKEVQFEVLTTQDYDSTVGQTVEVPVWTARKITPPDKVALFLVDGDLIQVGDMEAFVAAQDLPFTIERNMNVDLDKLDGDGEIWTIADFGPVRTGEQVAMYRLQLRR